MVRPSWSTSNTSPAGGHTLGEERMREPMGGARLGPAAVRSHHHAVLPGSSLPMVCPA
jgi:hypothetical protein